MAKRSAERRRYPRAKLNILIQYRLNTFEEFLVEYASDISEGGMFIRSDDPRPQGALVYFQFALKDGTRLIEGLGKVVHSATSGEPRGMGIEFVNFDDDSRAMVKAIVDARAEVTPAATA
jgi:uncharacterized protein (TIGR02266 family)